MILISLTSFCTPMWTMYFLYQSYRTNKCTHKICTNYAKNQDQYIVTSVISLQYTVYKLILISLHDHHIKCFANYFHALKKVLVLIQRRFTWLVIILYIGTLLPSESVAYLQKKRIITKYNKALFHRLIYSITVQWPIFHFVRLHPWIAPFELNWQ